MQAIAVHIDSKRLMPGVKKEGTEMCQAFDELMKNMKMKGIRRKYLIILAVLLALPVSGCTPKEYASIEKKEKDTAVQESSEEETAALGMPIQETSVSESKVVFEGRDMEENEISSDIFSQSKLTMVNVWATYCNPCLSEMPGLGELAGEYEPEEFQIIGIISDVVEGDSEEMTDLAAELIEQTGADYPHLLLNQSIYFALLADVTAVPTTFFVDENGVVIDTVVGAMKKSAWEEKINALLESR